MELVILEACVPAGLELAWLHMSSIECGRQRANHADFASAAIDSWAAAAAATYTCRALLPSS